MKQETGEEILQRHFPKLHELTARSSSYFSGGVGFGLIMALRATGSITNEQFTRLKYWLDCANAMRQA